MSFMDELNPETSTDLVDKIYKKVQTRKQLKKCANDFRAQSEYSAARDILQELLGNQEENEDCLETLFQIAECDMMTLKKISSKTSRRIWKTLQMCGISSNGLHEMASQQSDSLAVIIYLYACKSYVTGANPNRSVKSIESCMMTASRLIAKMMESHNLKRQASKIALLMVEMVQELKNVKQAEGDLHVNAIANCLNRVGYLLDDMARYHEAVEYLKEGRRIMRRHYGKNAKRRQLYATMANNIGASLLKQINLQEAFYYHTRAVHEVQEAEDISEEERKKDLKNYRRGLSISETRRSMKTDNFSPESDEDEAVVYSNEDETSIGSDLHKCPVLSLSPYWRTSFVQKGR